MVAWGGERMSVQGAGTTYSGFPPIREFREIFEEFFQSGKSGKNQGFSAKIREKISNQGTFFQTIFKPFKPINLRKMLRLLKLGELSGNCSICID